MCDLLNRLPCQIWFIIVLFIGCFDVKASADAGLMAMLMAELGAMIVRMPASCWPYDVLAVVSSIQQCGTRLFDYDLNRSLIAQLAVYLGAAFSSKVVMADLHLNVADRCLALRRFVDIVLMWMNQAVFEVADLGPNGYAILIRFCEPVFRLVMIWLDSCDVLNGLFRNMTVRMLHTWPSYWNIR